MSQIAFKDEDVANLRKFVELVRDKAQFNLSMEEAILLTKLTQYMQAHIRKVNDHVMELLRVHHPDLAPPPTGSEASTSTKE